MLPIPKLDDESYEEIVRYAISQIPLYSDTWTDHNEHDPGITFLELFAWLKEAQQYYLEHMERMLKPEFLRLLGTQMRRSRPARGLLRLYAPSRRETLLPGAAFFAGGVCFTLLQSAACFPSDVDTLITSEKTVYELHNSRIPNLQMRPFGESPAISDSFEIRFTAPLSDCQTLSLYFRVENSYPIRRNPLQSGFLPLAELEAEVKTEMGWKSCALHADETAAFTENGMLTIQTAQAETVTAVRFRLTKAYYEIPPVLTEVSMHHFPVVQSEEQVVCLTANVTPQAQPSTQHTATFSAHEAFAVGKRSWYYFDGDGYLEAESVTETPNAETVTVEFFAEAPAQKLLTVCEKVSGNATPHAFQADGLPNQAYDLKQEHLAYDDFALLVYEPFYQKWYLWEKTDSFAGADKFGRVYLFDEVHGKIRFGDGLHGRIPDGEIRVISLSRTDAGEGNLQDSPVTASSHPSATEGGAQIHEISGGCSAETPQACFLRYRRESENRKRAVTASDYRELISQTPGLMIRSCHVQAAADEENCLNITVEPYTLENHAVPNPIYAENLRRFLEPKKLIGTKLNLHFPHYVPLEISVAVSVPVHKAEAEQQIRKHLEQMFSEKYHRFGKPVLYNEIYAEIDLLEEVRAVRMLNLVSRDDAVRVTQNRDILLPENGIAYLHRLEIGTVS